ncbi:MAG: nitrite/sulfite reductase, partial [Leptospiraceae bacterium]|nr:nitrite/sulfite reductase [Leptospiraceae bacterium]
MKASNHLWKNQLADRIADDLGREIDIFETEMDLRRQGKIDEKLFSETRLRRGAYGQRYDNGQRHDGLRTRDLPYPDHASKGPNTVWEAPGMLRIKIPYGGMSAEQCEVLAELAEEYSDGIAHVTTRQDFQLHFIHIDDTPGIMRRLAAVGITTREACGNSVRNVTACPIAGVCHSEAFDVTPYAKALTYFLLGHPDTYDFGRKFKIAFSGCGDNGCGLTGLHDLGLIAVTREENGVTRRGFKYFVGGGLGAVPHQARLLDEFVTEEELLPLTQAVCRVFARLGEKKNRARARVKFLVAKLGMDEFRQLVHAERKILPPDARWTAYLDDLNAVYSEGALREPGSLNGNRPEGFEDFLRYNVYHQRQQGYSTVTLKLPLGDITATQLRALADISRKYIKDTIRTTVEQNMVLRWVSDSDLPALFTDLKQAGLAAVG